jgi:hypothetical protein
MGDEYYQEKKNYFANEVMFHALNETKFFPFGEGGREVLEIF